MPLRRAAIRPSDRVIPVKNAEDGVANNPDWHFADPHIPCPSPELLLSEVGKRDWQPCARLSKYLTHQVSCNMLKSLMSASIS
ncbi:hypothetical protein RD1_2386 [Roseobacter denitrificans OCh 114]|uniref:Uncharacterized protein n=1 Tax=Roseobacter denitrificans (strain ATCC 33942 / OCh 114) TaxID=375451 RepID=Q166Y7_ROSDO|nr:hypothetical protein RD1_2386 [Roseobacter denitrificans OCh 114]